MSRKGPLLRKGRRSGETLLTILVMAVMQVVCWADAREPQEKADLQLASGEELIKENDCTGCHAVDRKLVGPAFVDIANRYDGKPETMAKLSQEIKMGGSGNWGTLVMTAHPNLTDVQLANMVAYVLSLRGHVAQDSEVKPTKEYTYSLRDGKTVKLNFPIFEEGQTKKATKDVFKGYELYDSYCYRCHGQDVTGSEIAPDLRHTLNGGMSQKEFLAVAMTGREPKGMPSWAGFLTEEEVWQIFQYVKGRSLDLVPVGRPELDSDSAQPPAGTIR